MIYARPSDTIYSVLRGALSGQAGTLTVALRRLSDSTIVVAATTAGITEQDAGGTYSNYTGAISIPAGAVAGVYQPEWTLSGETYVDDELVTVTETGAAPVTPGPAYATIAHVEALSAQLRITASSQPNLTQVGYYLAETAAVLDGILSARGYSLPVATTATSALTLLQYYNALGGHAKTLHSHPGTPDPLRESAEKAWADAQKMLKDGLIEPVGLTRDTASSNVRVGTTPSALFFREMSL